MPASPPSDPLPYDTTAAARAIAKRCRTFGAAIKRVGPMDLSMPRLRAPFPYLMRAIIGQQLSGKAAATIWGRVEQLFPSRNALTPANLDTIPDTALRAAGVSGNKLLALRDLGKHAAAGTVPGMAALRRMDDREIIERLTTVRGIGEWTVQMLLMFRLGRPDVMPIADLGVRKGYGQIYGMEMPTPKELLKLTEHFSPWRTVVSWYCWRVLDTK